ncbi:MAG: malto-oligosyltrehalose trehalohydrolase [Chloroflexota bacterium]|nr:malto-oligosyltrehalose trehalohydrolase [Chloroflexota bacterium]MDQ5867398.1 malto-oligosyltrehalose trehalohydrolase [Chloroflexota bacterium]
MMNWQLPLGAQLRENGVRFRVWAEAVERVEVAILGAEGKEERAHELARDPEGYFEGLVEGIGAGTRYMYRLNGDTLRPDPASRYQPEGVHGPSEVVDPAFQWSEGAWRGLPLEEMLIYEVHIGTATPEGTFEAFIEKLPYLESLGVNTIEIMPVADFPGERNWGYDGVDLFAPANAYGGPEGLKRLVDAAHARGIAVLQDVVYNHLGPDGNYLRDFSRSYFTEAHKTPWGDALNYANPHVREFFLSNAIYWAQEYNMDGLRLDATHAILDDSDPHILKEIPARIRETLPSGRHFVVTAEDERNDVSLITPTEQGGAGIDAVWADDFHHEVRSAVAGDNEGYYIDYTGEAADIAATLNQGWFYTGQKSRFSGHKRGTDASRVDPPHFVYCIQNHDQIGNRPLGDRLTESTGLDAYRAASALLLLAPYTPLLFQGQEWAASTPFLFFTHHNPELGKLVTEGRRSEFASFKGFHGEEVPDPQAASTFMASKLNWHEVEEGEHAQTLALYRELLRLRATLPAFKERRRASFRSSQVGTNGVAMRYLSSTGGDDLLVIVSLRGEIDLALAGTEIVQAPEGCRWQPLLSTEESRFGGPQVLDGMDGGQVRANGPLAVAFQAVRA